MANLFGTTARIPQIKQTSIQPAGIPGSTFIRPQQREVGGNAARLAEALGSMNSALQNFTAVQKADEDDPNTRANKEQVARLQQMNREQLAAEIASGSLDGQRVQQDAAELLLAERANDDLRKRWAEFYSTEFDRASGDANAAFAQMREEVAGALPSGVSRGHLYRLSADFGRAWMEKDAEDKIAVVKQEIGTTIIGSFRAAVDDAMGIHGKSVKEAARIVFEKSAQNRIFLDLSGQEQNDTIFLLAQEYANRGDETMARALLEGARTGADGRPVPALITIPAYSAKAYRLLDEAGAKADKDFRENNLPEQVADENLVAGGAFTQAEADKRLGKPGYSAAGLSQMVATSQHNLQQIHQKAAQNLAKRERRRESERQENRVYAQAYAAMTRMGGKSNIRDTEIISPTGEGTKTLSEEAIIDGVVDIREREFAATQADLIDNKGMEPEAARAVVNRERLTWFSQNNIENATWKDALNGFAARANLDTLLSKDGAPEYLKANAKLYRDLKTANPAYVKGMLTNSQSREFLETYEAAMERGLTEDDALSFSASAVARPESEKAKSMIPYQDARKLADDTLSALGLDDRAGNLTRVMGQIESMSKHGGTEREIKAAIEKDILATSVPINGVLVSATNELPPDFPELMTEEIEARFPEIAKRYGIEDVSDLYIEADPGEKRWYIAAKPLPGHRIDATNPITVSSLRVQRSKKEAAQAEKVKAIAKAKDAERANLKAEYDAGVAKERARIAHWRKVASKKGGLAKSYADTVANDLQQRLDERLARDRDLIHLTGEQRIRKATDQMLPPDEVEAWKKRNGIE